MSLAIRVSDKLASEAKRYSKIEHRSITGQIEHWAMIGKAVEENPDMSFLLIKDILLGIAELNDNEKSEYKFG
jgi:hypothetical protein